MRITNLFLAAGLLVGFSGSALADITWNFNTTTFCLHCGFANEVDNDIKAGSFFITDDTGANLLNWDITVEGTNTDANNEYTPLDSFRTNPMDANHIDLYDGGSNQYLDLFFDAPGITSAGGTVNLLVGDLGADADSTIACNGCSTLVSGSVWGAGAAVPEPKFGVLLLAGLAGLGFMARRKFAAARS